MDKTKKKKKGYFRKYFVHDIHKIPCLLAWYVFFRPKKILVGPKATKNIKGGALVCLPHRSFADITYIQLISPFRRNFIIASEVSKVNKFITWILEHLLTIFIDRDHFSYGQFRNIVNILREGKIINIYCEGHINPNPGTIEPVKEGVILMAQAGKVPLIPVYTKVRQSIFERLRIGYGEPIYLDELGLNTRDKLSEACDYLRNKLIELMEAVEGDYLKHHPKKKRKEDKK